MDNEGASPMNFTLSIIRYKIIHYKFSSSEAFFKNAFSSSVRK